ncbi:hypothetical protein Tco_1527588, partial [Tanacetum coccineum]
VNPCNGREMRPVVESITVIIPALYKPQVGRPPKKRKKSNYEIASQSASSGNISRKGKSIMYGKCGNVGHNKKGCRGQSSASQAGGSGQAGARKVSGQASSARKASSQSSGSIQAGARKVYGQAAGARKASSQSGGSSQPSASQSTATGARSALSQDVCASQPIQETIL